MGDINIATLVKDPDFQSFPLEERVAALKKAGATEEFLADYTQATPEAPAAKPVPLAKDDAVGHFKEGIADVQSQTGTLDKLIASARAAMQQPVPEAVSTAMGPAGSLLKAGGGTGEGVLELSPAVGAMVGTVLGGGVPGAAGGAAAGEAWRQNIRRALGMPAATGVAQKYLGLDPDSPGAALSGMGMEGAVAPIADAIGTMLKGASGVADRSALRNLVTLMDPRKKIDKHIAMELAERARDEGLAPTFVKSHKEILANSEQALAQSEMARDAEAAHISNAGGTVATAGPVSKIVGAVPPVMPHGGIPVTGAPARTAAENVVLDTRSFVDDRARVPFAEANEMRDQWDSQVKNWDSLTSGKGPVENAANAWRHEINGSFPQFGELQAKFSDLIDITKLLKEAQVERDLAPLGKGDSHSGFMATVKLAKAGLHSGPWAAFSSSGKTMLRELLKGGAGAVQAWLRIADQHGIPDELGFTDRPGGTSAALAAEHPLLHQTGGSPGAPPASPTPAVSEDEFLRRYQQ